MVVQLMKRGVVAALLLLLVPLTATIELDVNDPASIKKAASNVAYGLVSYYSGNDTGGTPGLLPYPPYFWWESGAMMNSLVNYWYYTGDDTYNNLTVAGLAFQAGPGNAYIPTNQSFDEGIDDQLFWAFASMSAAEYNFPNPPADQPQYLELTQGVINSQIARWDYATCGGGLRWQFDSLNSGYLLKTSACNAGFFNVCARLGAYTGNQTYFHWANRAWDWMVDVGMISENNVVFDNTNTDNNCTTLDHTHWTYTTGMALNGAAVMWNQTQTETWKNRTTMLWNNSLKIFFVDNPPMVMREVCEPTSTCDLNEVSFKGYLARFAAASTKVASFLYPLVKPYLAASASAAALQCSGGQNQSLCGYHWTQEGNWDGTYGVGQQIAALEVIQANLIHMTSAPVSSGTGGTSTGDPNAGTGLVAGSGDSGDEVPLAPVSTADKAGAGILTAVALLATIIGAWWMVESPTSPPARLTQKLPKA